MSMNNFTDTDYANLALDKFLTIRINRLSSALGRQATVLLAKESNLSLLEWRLIRLLVNRPDSTARELNRVSGINTAQISHGVRRLDNRKLITVMRDPIDRRAYRLKLTTLGRQLYTQALPVMNRRYQALCALLSEEESKMITDILDRLDAHAKILDFPE